MCQALLPIGVSSEGHSCGPAASQPSVGGAGAVGPGGAPAGPPGGPRTPALSSKEAAQCWGRGGSALGTGPCPNRVTMLK